jgi:hypothetical protein
VTEVGRGKDLFLNIKIKPAADLSKLEEVLVLVEKQEQPAASEDAVHLRASDILAQRLPSVPDKPAAEAKSAAGAAGTGTRNPATPLPAQTKPQIKPQIKAAKNSSGASSVHVTPLPEPPTEPADADSTPSRKSDGTGVPTTAPTTIAPTTAAPITAAEPDAAETKPAVPRPKSGSPSTPSPTPPPNSQPPVDPNSPQ